jgi:hypothetical protein
MSKVIKAIAANYSTLPVNCPDRIKAFGIVLNNTVVGGVQLNQHSAGKLRLNKGNLRATFIFSSHPHR